MFGVNDSIKRVQFHYISLLEQGWLGLIFGGVILCMGYLISILDI